MPRYESPDQSIVMEYLSLSAEKMVCIIFVEVIETKVINCQSESNWASGEAPYSRCIFERNITVQCQLFT